MDNVELFLQVSHCGILQQGEAQCGGVQLGLHSHLATLSAQGLWAFPHLLQL